MSQDYFKTNHGTLYRGDCLELMQQIPPNTIDMILSDLPYNMTQNNWDIMIPLDKLWGEYERIIKPHGAIVLTAIQPFASKLVMSNSRIYKHEWIWKKRPCGHLNATKQPLRNHESVLVFYDKQCKYNPQMRPCLENKKNKKLKLGQSTNYGKQTDSIQFKNKKSYPRTIIGFNRDRKQLHPTQKPTGLFKYLIETYTDEGDTVLDNCAGVGTTALACVLSNRKFICMEKETKYYEIAKKRISQSCEQ